MEVLWVWSWGQQNSFNQLAALTSRTGTHFPQFFYLQILYRGVFFQRALFQGSKARKKENQIMKVSSSWPPLHGVMLETLRNEFQVYVFWGRKGETFTQGLPLTICQSAKPHTTQKCRLRCILFSVEQGPVTSHWWHQQRSSRAEDQMCMAQD